MCVAVRSPQKKQRPLHRFVSLMAAPRVFSLSSFPLTSRQAKLNCPTRYRLPCYQVDFLLQRFFVFLANSTEDNNPQPLFQSPDPEEVFKPQQVYQQKLMDVFSLQSNHSHYNHPVFSYSKLPRGSLYIVTRNKNTTWVIGKTNVIPSQQNALHKIQQNRT